MSNQCHFIAHVLFLPLYLQVPAAVAGLEPFTLGLQGVYSSEVLPPLSIAQVFLKHT
jgi:hypothetical protein